jgi:hypothetical protein
MRNILLHSRVSTDKETTNLTGKPLSVSQFGFLVTDHSRLIFEFSHFTSFIIYLKWIHESVQTRNYMLYYNLLSGIFHRILHILYELILTVEDRHWNMSSKHDQKII